MEMQVVTVLDFNAGEVYVYYYSPSVEDIEEYIAEKGHQISNCQWMCTEKLILTVSTN
jgi:hypothetical protein